LSVWLVANDPAMRSEGLKSRTFQTGTNGSQSCVLCF